MPRTTRRQPPSGAIREAERALTWATDSSPGRRIAEDIVSGRGLTLASVRAAASFFSRHAADTQADGFRLGDDGFPSPARVAWSLHGGDTMNAWCDKVLRTSGARRKAGSLEERSQLMEGVERRFVGPFENVEAPDFDMLGIEERADEPGKPLKTYLVGYAAVFGQDSVLLGDFVERIEPSAFDIVKAGKDKKGKPLQTRGLFNHDPNHLLGRYPSTMQMWVDDKGLKYSILLPESRRDIAEMVRRGDLRGSSFSFIVAPGGEKWHYESGQSIRTVTAIKALVDCGPVTYPAYEASSVAVAQRSLQVFKQGGGDRELRRAAARASIMAEVEKTRQWLLERRDCGQESDGKFGKGNTCQGGGSDGGPTKVKKGDSLHGLLSASKNAAKAGLTDKQFDALARAAGAGSEFNDQAGLGVYIKQDNGNKFYVNKDLPVPGVSGTVLTHEPGELIVGSGGSITPVGSPTEGGVAEAEKLAGAAGISNVLVSAPNSDASAAKMLSSKGYKSVGPVPNEKVPATYFLKSLGKSNRSETPAIVSGYATRRDDLLNFLAERRDCGQESDGKFGKGNTCALGAASPGPKRIEKTTGGTSIKKMAKMVAHGSTTGGIIGGTIAGAQAFGSGAIDAAAAAGAASGGITGSFAGAAKAAGSALAGGAAIGAAAGAAGVGGLIAGEKIGKWISPHTKQNHLIGILTTSAGAAIGGLPGVVIGAAASGIGQALYGRYREHTEAHLAKSKKDLSINDAKVSKAKGVLDPGNEDFVQKSFADGHVMFAGPSGEAHVFKVHGDSKAHVNFDADSGLGAEDAAKLAKSLGARYVFHETKSKDDIPGFMRVQEQPLIKGNTVHMKNLKSPAKRYDELVQFLAERRSGGGCGRDADGKFGSGNTCQGASGGGAPPERGDEDSKYMEWKPGEDHKSAGKTEKAQKFIDKARKDQTISAGKDGGKSDDGGGVQTWSKGDHFPWVVKQVGDHDGHLQGVHPDGSKTAKYPFYGGDTSIAAKQVSDEISKRKKSK